MVLEDISILILHKGTKFRAKTDIAMNRFEENDVKAICKAGLLKHMS